MDKHTKRYLFEFLGHESEGIDMGQMIQYINQANPSDGDIGYLQEAIQSEFSGLQQDYLRMKLWDKLYGEGGN